MRKDFHFLSLPISSNPFTVLFRIPPVVFFIILWMPLPPATVSFSVVCTFFFRVFIWHWIMNKQRCFINCIVTNTLWTARLLCRNPYTLNSPCSCDHYSYFSAQRPSSKSLCPVTSVPANHEPATIVEVLTPVRGSTPTTEVCIDPVRTVPYTASTTRSCRFWASSVPMVVPTKEPVKALVTTLVCLNILSALT